MRQPPRKSKPDAEVEGDAATTENPSEPLETTPEDSQDAPSLGDAVGSLSGAPAAPAPAPKAGGMAAKFGSVSNDMLLKIVARTFTVGLPITPEMRRAFVEAYADDEFAQYGIELINQDGGALAIVDTLVQTSPFARLALGGLLLAGTGFAARMEYVAALHNAQAQGGALFAGSVGTPNSRDPGFTADDLSGESVIADAFAAGGNSD
jgi:hypothetical protein